MVQMLCVFEYQAIKFCKLQQEITVVDYENGYQMRGHCNLPGREGYWLENNTYRLGKIGRFVCVIGT